MARATPSLAMHGPRATPGCSAGLALTALRAPPRSVAGSTIFTAVFKSESYEGAAKIETALAPTINGSRASLNSFVGTPVLVPLPARGRYRAAAPRRRRAPRARSTAHRH